MKIKKLPTQVEMAQDILEHHHPMRALLNPVVILNLAILQARLTNVSVVQVANLYVTPYEDQEAPNAN